MVSLSASTITSILRYVSFRMDAKVANSSYANVKHTQLSKIGLSVHQGKSQSQEQSRLKTSGIAVEIDNTKDSTNSNSGFIPSRGRIPADSESLDELDGNQPSNGLVRYTATSANFADRKGDVNSNAIGRTANRATPDGLMMINLRPSVIRFGHEILDDDSLIQAFDNLTACIDQYVLHYIVSEPERWLLKDTNRVHGNNLIPHHVPILRRIFGVPIGVPIKQKIFHLEPDDTLPTKLVVRGLLAYIVQEIVFRKSSIFPDDSILANILQEVGNPEVRSILIQEHRFRLQLRDPELRKRIAQVNEDDLKRLNQVMACVISSDPDTQGRHRELAKLANELNARISSYTRAKWTCIWATHGTNFNPAIHELSGNSMHLDGWFQADDSAS
ncbi:hypothetical protein PVAG01_01785 [Phlyctema vagabunda]|uniref:Uncharacterized protein n=1 Tax=Phlyctema vagabunda TaxID=108571 RepID=A0ABR4PYE5_9HELO